MKSLSEIHFTDMDEENGSLKSLEKPGTAADVPKILFQEFQRKLNNVGATLLLCDDTKDHISLSVRFTTSGTRPDMVITTQKECIVVDMALSNLIKEQLELVQEIFTQTKTLAHQVKCSFYLKGKDGVLKNCSHIRSCIH